MSSPPTLPPPTPLPSSSEMPPSPEESPPLSSSQSQAPEESSPVCGPEADPSSGSSLSEPEPPAPPTDCLPRTRTSVTVSSTATSHSRPSAGVSWQLVLERNQTLRKSGQRGLRERSQGHIDSQQRRKEQLRRASEVDRSEEELVTKETGGERADPEPVDFHQVTHTKTVESFKSLKTDSTPEESQNDGALSFVRPNCKGVSAEGKERDVQPPPPKPDDDEHSHPPGPFQVDPSGPGPVCALCHHADVGYLLSPCTCTFTRPMHFHCLKQKILAHKSFLCDYCGETYLGVEPLYDHLPPSRLINASFTFFLCLLVLLLGTFLFLVAPDYAAYFRALFTFFGAISLLSFLLYALLRCYSVYYNATNERLVDVLVEPDTVCLLT